MSVGKVSLSSEDMSLVETESDYDQWLTLKSPYRLVFFVSVFEIFSSVIKKNGEVL